MQGGRNLKVLGRAKRGHKISLAVEIKENPKTFYNCIKGKRIIRVRVWPIRDKNGNLCMELRHKRNVKEMSLYLLSQRRRALKL